MTLKEEFEILRGEPIEVFTGDPMDIPCIETSDPEKLCKHPVVSVQMITYNHEPYIRQAIEGVMMQKTDFEFELIIGEDCSQDKTREICFEYQKKYPDKIRVLWWQENVSKLGGNGRRCRARCRGEFVALCEGDDYWIDPQKLQKQVDIMRKYPNVGLCYTDGRFLRENKSVGGLFHSEVIKMPVGMIRGAIFLRTAILGRNPRSCRMEWSVTLTCSTLCRASLVKKVRDDFEIFSWRLNLGDLQLWAGLASRSDVYLIGDDCVRYRVTRTGASFGRGHRVDLDGCLVKLFYFCSYYSLRAHVYPLGACGAIVFQIQRALWDVGRFDPWTTYLGRVKYLVNLLSTTVGRRVLFSVVALPLWCFVLLNMGGRIPLSIAYRFRRVISPLFSVVNGNVRKLYVQM